MSDNLIKSDNISDDIYVKSVRVMDAIDMKVLQCKNVSELALLKTIKYKMKLISSGIAQGADELTYEIRRELGEGWYINFRSLVKQNNGQRYIVGLAYEILYGNATEEHFLNALGNTTESASVEDYQYAENCDINISQVIKWILMVVVVFLILGIWI